MNSNHINPTIDILLSTYNGGEYLQQQLDSILNQTYDNWKVLIRDDGSTDETLRIIESYSSTYPKKFKFVDTGSVRLGASQSFAGLMEYSDSDYIMFCDQDDVWLPKKVEQAYQKMKQTESNQDQPVLIHTDLTVVNENLELISDSYWDYQRLNINSVRLEQMLVQNHVTGCTVLINKALKNHCLPIPVDAMMHDWWIALIAGVFGKIEGISESSILYRQHSKNHIGAKKYTNLSLLLKLASLKDRNQIFQRTIKQANALLKNYHKKLSSAHKQILYDYVNISKQNWFLRMKIAFRYEFFKIGFWPKVSTAFHLLILKRER
ncbi:hypothetical protein VN24_08445 [Paenibacillus beijingensis]|uniref:Glycosyltransferase 2-like domain-containing protein n=2 Tax=Paenibacillus beijingensis TaxID=1126833 RepID=A0A0D5NQS7_9BACL|nr:hypothetical protein VN24_08445 [Paenibacillus beijingensis]